MNCRMVESLVSAYLDGELTGVQMAQVRKHLADCCDCQREMESMRALKSLMSATRDMAADDNLHDRMMAGMAARSVKIDRRAWMTGLAAATSACAIAAAVIVSAQLHQPVEAAPISDNHYNAGVDGIYSVGADPYTNHVQAISVGMR